MRCFFFFFEGAWGPNDVFYRSATFFCNFKGDWALWCVVPFATNTFVCFIAAIPVLRGGYVVSFILQQHCSVFHRRHSRTLRLRRAVYLRQHSLVRHVPFLLSRPPPPMVVFKRC